MNQNQLLTAFKTWLSKIDWPLLSYLILVLDVKLAIKLAAILLACLYQRNFHFGFRPGSPRESKLPLFYLFMPAIAVLTWLFRHQFDLKQDVLLLSSLFFWGLCILIIHQLRLFAEKGDPEKLHGTITLFFLLNILISVFTLLGIMVKTGSLNPYGWLGDGQAYFISTGDHIQGITFDFSLVNALINAMGMIYFMMRKQWGLTIACMCVLLMTGSNLTNLLIAGVLVVLFFYRPSRAGRITVAVCLLLMFFFLKFVSPENQDYTRVTITNIAERKTVNVMAEQDTGFRVSAKETALMKKAEVMEEKYTFKPTPEQARFPGKVISYEQTLQFMLQHPWFLPLGTGAGHFSSKLAFRASALGTEGGYPAKFTYVDPNFEHNHLAVFLYYFTKGNQHHSIINTPYSVYNQALGEYGLAGVAALLIFYFGFFIRRSQKGLHVWLMLGLLAASFCTDYWFEQLSVVIIFELLWLVALRKSPTPISQKQTVKHGRSQGHGVNASL